MASDKVKWFVSAVDVNLLEVVDKALQGEINKDYSGTTQRVFDYYNSPEKPLNHREFIQFWASLTPEEAVEYFEYFYI